MGKKTTFDVMANKMKMQNLWLVFLFFSPFLFELRLKQQKNGGKKDLLRVDQLLRRAQPFGIYGQWFRKNTSVVSPPRQRRTSNNTKNTKRESNRKYLPAITTNLRKHSGSRKELKVPVPGCGPYCRYRERREFTCETCFLRFHVECVDSELLHEKEGKNYLPECYFCVRNEKKGWKWIFFFFLNYCVNKLY